MSKIILAHTAAGLLTAGTVSAATHFEFGPYHSFPIGSFAESVAIGDVNGDGRNDVVVATTSYYDEENDYHLFVYKQRTDGTLAVPVKYKYGEFTNSVAVMLGDLNRDGTTDIITGYIWGLHLMLSNGSGGFDIRDIPSDIPYTNLAVFDIDFDGNLDVIAQSWSQGANLLYGDGAGGFRSTTFLDTGAGGYNDIKVGDVTGDGYPDLVVVSLQSPNFYVYPHDRNGGFGQEVSYAKPDSWWSPSAVAIGDYDSDGRNEVVLSTTGNQPNSNLYVYEQNASGGLSSSPLKITTKDLPSVMVSHDLDRDGRMDLLVGHSGWFEIGRYMQGPDGLSREELASPAPVESAAHSLAVGDINGDGCTDAATATFNFGLTVLYGKGCKRLRSDFDGDGIADLLWHNRATGVGTIWKSANYRTQQGLTRVTNTDWRIATTGDFDGNGQWDIVWRNQATGAGTIWKSGNSATQQGLPRITDPAWQIVGAGDYDGDGKSDLLWRHAFSGKNAIWKSGNFATQQSIAAVTDVRWQAVGSGDFDRDGKDDIVWRHATSGRNAIWRSGNHSTQLPVTAVTDVKWKVAAIGDFDGDGNDDLFWRHAAGNNAIWRSAAYAQQLAVPKTLARWTLAAAADYDGNGRDDLMWRNTVDGSNVVWRSPDASIVRTLATVPDQNWRVHR